MSKSICSQAGLFLAALIAPWSTALAADTADQRWAEVAAVNAAIRNITGKTPEEMRLAEGNKRAEYRQLGLAFHRDFPTDARFCEWLLNTLQLVPRENAEQSAPGGWSHYLETALKPDFFAAGQATPEQRAEYRWREADRLWAALKADSPGAPADPEKFLPAVLAYAAEPAAEEHWLRRMFDLLDQLLRPARVDAARKQKIFAEMMASPNLDLQLLATGKIQVELLRRQALDLKLTGLDGQVVDLKSFRGKPVLVDIWGVYCAACVFNMPRIKAVYDRYRAQGFEVVGVCLIGNHPDEPSRMRKHLADTGASAWTNGLLTGGPEIDFIKTYSVVAVPVTWLLDRDGKLVTNDVRGPRLEQEVRRLLDLPPLPPASNPSSAEPAAAPLPEPLPKT